VYATAFVLFFVSMFLLRLVTSRFVGVTTGSHVTGSSMRLGLLLQTVAYIPLVFVPLQWLRMRAARLCGKPLTWPELFLVLGLSRGGLPEQIGKGFRTYLPTLAFFLVASVFSRVLFRHVPTTQHPLLENIGMLRDPIGRCLTFLVAGLIGPIVEEIMFRGLLYASLRQTWGPVVGMVVSGSIFAIIHPGMPVGFLPIFVLGTSFAFLYERE
jgi:membrane protease YdiL (CAAX protease family)